MRLSKTVQKYLKNIEKADLHKLKDQKETVPRRRNISEADKQIIMSIIDKRIERKMEKILQEQEEEEHTAEALGGAELLRPLAGRGPFPVLEDLLQKQAEARKAQLQAIQPPALQTMIDALNHKQNMSHIGIMQNSYKPGSDFQIHPVFTLEEEQTDFDKVDFFQHILQIMEQNQGKILKVETEDGKTTFFKIDENHLQHIQQYIINLIYDIDKTSDADTLLLSHGAKFEILNDIPNTIKGQWKQLNTQGVSISILEPTDLKEKRFYKRGKYFPYINTFPLDLSRYQIGRTLEEHKQLNNEHCLIYAFRMAGLDTSLLKSQMVDESLNFLARNLKNLITNVKFKLISFDKNDSYSEPITNCEKGEEQITICLYKGHYFLDEEIPVSTWFLQNYPEKDGVQIPADKVQAEKISNGKVK